jgi:hypothetical protein
VAFEKFTRCNRGDCLGACWHRVDASTSGSLRHEKFRGNPVGDEWGISLEKGLRVR